MRGHEPGRVLLQAVGCGPFGRMLPALCTSHLCHEGPAHDVEVVKYPPGSALSWSALGAWKGSSQSSEESGL